MGNNQFQNFYSEYSDEDLIKLYNQIYADKIRIDWAYYYVCQEMENRKQYYNNTPEQVVNNQGGFMGASQFQKTVDDVIEKELKKH